MSHSWRVDVPLDVLALDDARVRTSSTDGVEPTEQAAVEAEPSGAVATAGVRGKSARVGEGLASDPQGCDEADSVWVVPGVGGGLGHQGADRVVTAQMAPDLLQDQVRGLDRSMVCGSPQIATRTALRG